MCGYSKILFYYSSYLIIITAPILELMKVLSHIAQHFNLIPPFEAGMAFYLRLGNKKAEVQSGWTQIFLQTDF